MPAPGCRIFIFETLTNCSAGELSAAVELRRRFPGITDNTRAHVCFAQTKTRSKVVMNTSPSVKVL
jgi:hypothetical protein